MFVNLTVQRANLHMGFALVLQQFQLLRGLVRIVEKFVDCLRLDMLQTFFKTDSTLVENTELLETKSHVVSDDEKHNFVVWIVVSLNLLEHCLCFLQQNQPFFVGFLCNEVDGRLA